MAHPHPTYRPRDTEHSVLHAVIREHLDPFLREVSDRGGGSGLPRFYAHPIFWAPFALVGDGG